MTIDFFMVFLVNLFTAVMLTIGRSEESSVEWRGKSVIWAGPLGASVEFYIREAFQSQTRTEKTLYSKSR